MTARRDNPLVTVAMPAYNHDQYVNESLSSVLDDGYAHIELVVIDDGSTDSTWAQIEAWGDENGDALARFVALRQANAGIARVMNRLIDESTGEFIVFLASDDRLCPGSIQTRVHALQQRPDWRGVFGVYRVIDEHGKITDPNGFDSFTHGNQRALLDDRLRNWEIILNWPMRGSSAMLRRSAFDERTGVGRFDPRKATEDRNMYLRLMANNELGYVDAIVCDYRIHGMNYVSELRGSEASMEAGAASEMEVARHFASAQAFALRLYAQVRLAKLRKERSRGVWRRVATGYFFALRAMLNLVRRWHSRRVSRSAGSQLHLTAGPTPGGPPHE